VIVIPFLDQTGPIKGAIALSNGLVRRGAEVTVVALQSSEDRWRMREGSLAGIRTLPPSGPIGKVRALRKLLDSLAEEDRPPAIVSFCLKSDLCCSLLGSRYRKISSVRGNLMQNYYYQFGLPGKALAILHFLVLRVFSKVIAMSEAMESQLNGFGLRSTEVIPNFIEEGELEDLARAARAQAPARQGNALVLGFLGTLTTRKRLDLLLEAFFSARIGDARLHVLGDGPLAAELKARAVEGERLNPARRVIFHGHQRDPWKILIESDCLVLPSESEGISRACLEGLYLGVPCILRDVDANAELVREGENGFLFRKDEELAGALERAAEGSRRSERTARGEASLLPASYRQENCISRYQDLIQREA
jgi:glycosyltransferase involved in cell wall biosynthesis